MSGKNGYANKTIYNVIVGNDNIDNDMVTTITQTAAVTAAGTTGTAANTSGVTSHSYSSPINAEIAAAINQLLANQTSIMTQMAVMRFAPEPV